MAETTTRPAPGPSRTPAPLVVPASSPWVWPLRVVGVVLVGALVAAGAGSVVVGFFVREETTSVAEPGVTSVDAEIDTGDITVTGGPAGSDVVVRTHRRTAFQDASTTRTLVGGRLQLRTDCSAALVLDDTCSVDLDLVVPPGVTLALRTTSGTVAVDSLAGGSLAVRSSLGDVRLDELDVAGLTVTTAADDIDATFARPPQQVRLRAGIGDVSLAVPPVEGGYRVAADSSLGTPVVEVPRSPTSARVLDVATTAGDVQVVGAP